jgi:hypothetical protein
MGVVGSEQQGEGDGDRGSVEVSSADWGRFGCDLGMIGCESGGCGQSRFQGRY